MNVMEKVRLPVEPLIAKKKLRKRKKGRDLLQMKKKRNLEPDN
jgi:hypothetical protein